MTSFSSSARVNYDGTTIVLNLPDAIHPTVWRYDMSYVPGASFEIIPEGNAHCLRLKTSTGATHTIALYATKDAGMNVLSMIIDTIFNTADASALPLNQPEGSGLWNTRGKRMALLSVIIFIACSSIFLGMVNVPRQDLRLSKKMLSSSSANSAPAPRAAEDILKERLHEK